MGCRQIILVIVLFLWVFRFSDKTAVSSAVEVKGTVFVYGEEAVGTVDEDFICATLDWWPSQKCDYGTCAWNHASILNLVFFSLSFTFLFFFHFVSGENNATCATSLKEKEQKKKKNTSRVFLVGVTAMHLLGTPNLANTLYFLLKIFDQETKH